MRAARRLRIRGVHSYFGTDIMSPSTLIEGLRRLARVAASLPHLRYLDAGGGFGVPDDFDAPEFDLEGYGRLVATELRNVEGRLGRPIEARGRAGSLAGRAHRLVFHPRR